MELEELKANWATANRRLDQVQAVQVALAKNELKGRGRSAANRLRVEPIFELAISGMAVLWAGNFLAANFAKVQQWPVAAMPALALYPLAIATIWSSVTQLRISSELDYSEAIVDTQAKIASLKKVRVRSTQAMLLLGIPLWFLFPILLAQAMIRFEIALAVSPQWMLGNLVFGGIFSAGAVWAARRAGPGSRFFGGINRILAGDAVAEAEKRLREIAEFNIDN
jgi:hypothetical protein